MAAPGWLRRHGESLLAPLAVAALYAALIVTSGAGRISQIVAGMFFVAVLALWIGFRRLRVHAAASRLISIGRPDQLATLVARELPRRWGDGTRAPLHVFAAMGKNLAGDFAGARAELDRAGIEPGSKRQRGWQMMWAAADIHARTATGDVAGARRSYERAIAPMRALPLGGGIELVAIEAEARIKLAEGDAAAARALVTPLVKDIRLGPAARAQLHALLAAAAEVEGDAEAAAGHAEKARTLAPHCALVPAAG